MQYHIFSQQYEIKRIVAHRGFHRRSEYWVPWVGYDAAWDMWLHRDVLVEDVPAMVVAYHKLEGSYSLPMLPCRGAPKRASLGRLLLTEEEAFPSVGSGPAGVPAVLVRPPRVSLPLAASRELSVDEWRARLSSWQGRYGLDVAAALSVLALGPVPVGCWWFV